MPGYSTFIPANKFMGRRSLNPNADDSIKKEYMIDKYDYSMDLNNLEYKPKRTIINTTYRNNVHPQSFINNKKREINQKKEVYQPRYNDYSDCTTNCASNTYINNKPSHLSSNLPCNLPC